MKTKNENWQKAIAEHAEALAAFEAYARELGIKYSDQKGNFSKEMLTAEEKMEWERLEALHDAAIQKVKEYEKD